MEFKYDSVLVVDDNPIDILLHEKLISKSGLVKTVCSATSAQSGLEFIKNLILLGKERLIPTYIFLDVDMPLVDGFQFLKDLKDLNIPEGVFKGVIVLSAGGYNVNRTELNESDLFLKFIHKPLLEEHLTEL